MAYAVFKFKPLQPLAEVLEWRTDVIAAYNAEQRIAIRLVPRTKYRYRWSLSFAEYGELKTLLSTWAHQTFAVPIWTEGTTLNGIGSPNTIINLTTANAQYVAGEHAAVVGSDGEVTVAEIATVGASSLMLASAYTGPSSGTVYPARMGYFLEGFSFDRQGTSVIAEATLTTVEGSDLANTTSYDTYDSLDVVTDGYYFLSGAGEQILQSVELFDNGSGPIELDTNKDYLTRGFTANFLTVTRAERWSLRTLLHNAKGRRGAFWLPTWSEDLTAVATLTSGTNTLDISPIDFPTYGDTPQDIMVVKTDGTRVYNRITSAATLSPATAERLTVSTNWSSTITVSEIDKICFMHKVRFDADAIQLDYTDFEFGNTDLEHTRLSVPVREVPA